MVRADGRAVPGVPADRSGTAVCGERAGLDGADLRPAQHDGLLAPLAAHRDRVELFFSFASFRSEVHERLYGRDLRDEKQAALERAQQAGLFVTLVPTIERGVNDDEIGALYRFAL